MLGTVVPQDHNTKSRIQVGLALMLEEDFEFAARPLFEKRWVDVVEWSFDIGWGREIPCWPASILKEFSERRRLLGHGVTYSALDASRSDRQTCWLEALSAELATRNYRHVSEHFGFCGGGNFHRSAPLPVPRTRTAIRIGQARLRELSDVCEMPIGLENLAFAFHETDVKEQGEFIDQLLTPTDGFLLLDLHNLYCQAFNFGLDLIELARHYPLHRVREMHVSGGSLSEHPASSGNRVRRDTHDDAIPQQLFDALPTLLGLCPNTEFVLFERLGGTLQNHHTGLERSAEQFRADFQRLRESVGAQDG